MFKSLNCAHGLIKACYAAGLVVFLVLAPGLVMLQEVQAANTWTVTGSLKTGRWQHTCTLLPSGKILVVGGRDSSGNYLNTAELYDPQTRTWDYTGSLAGHPLANHTATLLASGKVLVTGGDNNTGELSECYLYNPADGSWSPTASLNTARTFHTATLLADGRVLVVGGANMSLSPPYLGSAEIYDPGSPSAWQDGGSLTVGRLFHTATRLLNGSVLVAGGYNNSYQAEASVEVFNGASWTPGGPLGTARWDHTATLLADGRVLVAGGVGIGNSWLASAELYNGAGWISAAPLHAARRNHTATLLRNGRVLVAGGYDGRADVVSAELFSPPGAGAWQETGLLHMARSSHAATRLRDGRVLAAGGNLPDYAGAEIYDPGSANLAAWMLLLREE